jgi:hypothetical protein
VLLILFYFTGQGGSLKKIYGKLKKAKQTTFSVAFEHTTGINFCSAQINTASCHNDGEQYQGGRLAVRSFEDDAATIVDGGRTFVTKGGREIVTFSNSTMPGDRILFPAPGLMKREDGDCTDSLDETKRSEDELEFDLADDESIGEWDEIEFERINA